MFTSLILAKALSCFEGVVIANRVPCKVPKDYLSRSFGIDHMLVSIDDVLVRLLYYLVEQALGVEHSIFTTCNH